MLTYTFNDHKPLYSQLYSYIKTDIQNGILSSGEKLPSKRSLAKQLNISTITVENAYLQLLDEGFIYALPRSGYYVSKFHVQSFEKKPSKPFLLEDHHKHYSIDLSSHATSAENFPFSIWAKLSRQVLSNHQDDLMKSMPTQGTTILREAIAQYLNEFRNLKVSKDQIIIGAGTEYLYSLLIQLLGTHQNYGIEVPGYRTLHHIYDAYNLHVKPLYLDKKGIKPSSLKDVNVIHTTPSHHFPTGITMPLSRRMSLLEWANEEKERYIIEDDYDSEFRMMGKPLPPLFSLDQSEHVIYMNTFTKSLSSTIRISYMVLPPHLAIRFNDHLSFYNCTVSSFEQYTLAYFIQEGYFEKHINRMRNKYRKKRNDILSLLTESPLYPLVHIKEENAGLHFLLEIKQDYDYDHFISSCHTKGLHIKTLKDYGGKDDKTLIINYSSLPLASFKEAINILYDVLKKL